MPESSGEFKIACGRKELDRLNAWRQQAESEGWLSDFTAALRTIQEKLAAEPLNWGEALCRLRMLDLTVCIGICRPLQVRYAVDAHRNIVHIKTFGLLPIPPSP